MRHAPVTMNGVSQTFDALGHMIEQGYPTEYFTTPDGLARVPFKGQQARYAAFKLPGGAVALYDPPSGGLVEYQHPDHLGNLRFAATPARAYTHSLAYAPFGELYAQGGSLLFGNFIGQGEPYTDFPARQYDNQGRWASPDPAGLAAVSMNDPQSLNRYAYVLDDPTDLIDPLGLDGTPCTIDGEPGICVTTVDKGGGNGGGTSGSGGGIRLCELFMNCGFDGGGGGVAKPEPSRIHGDPDRGRGGRGLRSIYIVNSNGRTCTPSLFDPSCKPPSCPAVFLNAAAGADLGLPPNADEAAKMAATAAATNRIVSRGLVKPLASSYVRGALLFGDVAADLLSLGPILVQEVVGLTKEIKAWRAGTCTTIWSKP